MTPMVFVDNQWISLDDNTFGLMQREMKFQEKSWAKHSAEKAHITLTPARGIKVIDMEIEEFVVR